MPDGEHDRYQPPIQRRKFREFVGQMSGIEVVSEGTESDHDSGEKKNPREDFSLRGFLRRFSRYQAGLEPAVRFYTKNTRPTSPPPTTVCRFRAGS
jgi:hypothetical protein